MMTSNTVGYLGLGTMGAPMAENLLNKGYVVHTVVHKTPAPRALIDKGLIVVPDLPTLAQKCPVVLINVPDAPQVESLIFGSHSSSSSKAGLIASLSEGAFIIDNSTIAPRAARDIAQRLILRGIHFLDAPVSGGVVGAQSAQLTIMVGGVFAAFSAVKPILACLGKKITYLGESGAGQVCKAANQTAIAGALLGIMEALILAEKQGLDARVVREVLMAGSAQSKALEYQGGRMAERDFVSRFSSALYQKDMNIVRQLAEESHLLLPATMLINQMLDEAVAQGEGEEDAAALIKVLQRKNGG